MWFLPGLRAGGGSPIELLRRRNEMSRGSTSPAAACCVDPARRPTRRTRWPSSTTFPPSVWISPHERSPIAASSGQAERREEVAVRLHAPQHLVGLEPEQMRVLF